MFGHPVQRLRGEPGRLASIAAVAAALIGLQAALLFVLVGLPLGRAALAAREPRPAVILVRVPEYVEEIDVVGPPRWQREHARAEAQRRGLGWLAGATVDGDARRVCPVTQ